MIRVRYISSEKRWERMCDSEYENLRVRERWSRPVNISVSYPTPRECVREKTKQLPVYAGPPR